MDETTTLSVANAQPKPVLFCVEPHGASTSMPPGAVWTITARLAAGEHLAVEMDEHRIVVRAGESFYAPVAVSQGQRTVLDCGLPATEALFDPYESRRTLARA